MIKYEQKLFGKLNNGNVFITNPTRCDTWNSWGYAEFYATTDGANSDPLGTGTQRFYTTDAVPTAPDCSSLAPFTTTAESTIVGGERGDHASLQAVITMPGLGGEPLGAAGPKKIATTLPRAVTIDVAQLTRVCSDEAFASNSCPASTQVGDVQITTPMIADGLTGKAYLVKASAGHSPPRPWSPR